MSEVQAAPIDQVAALLSGQEPAPPADETPPADEAAPAEAAPPPSDEAPPADETPPAEPEAPPITSFKELAQAAGIDMKSLYELTIGFGDGSEPMTLGAMKDQIVEHLGVDQRIEEFEGERREFDNNVMRARQEINEILHTLNVSPEQAQEAARVVEANKARAERELLSAVPALADPDVRKATHARVVEAAAEYGIAGHEIDNMTDHRAYKALMDLAELRQKFADADAARKKVRKGKSVGNKRAQDKSGDSAVTQSLIQQAETTGLPHDQVNAVAAILGGVKP